VPETNIYFPYLLKVEEIMDETPDVKTFRLSFLNENEEFSFEPGQFAVCSIFSQGEAAFTIANPPTDSNLLECSVKRVGKVSGAFHDLNPGDIVGVRGPYGRGFDLDRLRGKNLLFVGGGIGFAALRSLLYYSLDNRPDFKGITLLYGARSVADLVYKKELEELQEREEIEVALTVDPGGETPDWEGEVGLVPPVLEELAPSPEETVAVVCGPPIMIKFTFQSLGKLGFAPDQIVTTLEMKMKCGVGKCGRCNIGSKYVCRDGPVFWASELERLPDEF
jgi:NAD(P)H-flavin reductase